jgi:hypothetical protein
MLVAGVLTVHDLFAAAPAPPQAVTADASQTSVRALRMRTGGSHIQMPPLSTDIAHSEALALIERWIDRNLQTSEELKA